MGFQGALGSGYALLRLLPDLAWFAKDRQGRFLAANSAFVSMAGLRDEARLLGMTDFDIWPRFLAEHYVQDDARVMETSAPMVNKLELVLRQDGSADWFATTKAPLLGPGGELIGVEGVCRYLRKGKAAPEPVLTLSVVIDFIMENYTRKIDIPDLAGMVSLSVKQFERRFKHEYGSAPVQYIQRIRLDAAQQLLAASRLPIARIGRETGFHDSSHFSKQFLKYTGLSPKAFREQHRVSFG